MNIKPNNYYVTRGLNVVLAEKTITDSYKMKIPDYKKKEIPYTVCSEGFFNSSKKPYSKDILEELTNKTETNDLYIIDLFQLADYTLNTLYTTAKDKNENVKVYDSENSKIKIYHSSTDKVLYYPVVSIFGATHTANKISKLHKALEGF